MGSKSSYPFSKPHKFQNVVMMGGGNPQIFWKLTCPSPSFTITKKHTQLALIKQSPCLVSPLCPCHAAGPVHRDGRTHAGQWMWISFACMYESLPDISPEASGILIASHLPYVCSICLSLHPSLNHLIPLQQMKLKLPWIQQLSHLKLHIRVFLAY